MASDTVSGGRGGPGQAHDAAIETFRIAIPDADLQDLNDRLAATRWPDEITGAAWEYGVSLDYVRDLVAYWRSEFDWRAMERSLNGFPQFVTSIDGQRIHFLHVRSPNADAMPLLLTHGWPGSFAEFVQVIGPLADPETHDGDPADAFHVVVPSLPGYAFSGPTSERGWGVRRIAEAWATLMQRLGYARYGVQGGDWGARISPEVARTVPDRVVGVHVNSLVTLPRGAAPELGDLTPPELARLANLERWQREKSGYAAIQATRPLTLAFGLSDSPAGLLAWNAEWFTNYGAKPATIDADTILTHVSIYWHTRTAASAVRLYREAAAGWGAPAACSHVPTGIAVFAGDSSIRKFAEQEHNIVHWSEFDAGGHFAALEVPDLLVNDVRAFFRGLRGSRSSSTAVV